MKTGVLASYREEFILIKEHVLTDEQFVLYQFCVHQADFDIKHKEKFGTLLFSNTELADSLNWSVDKVGRNIKVLIEKGFLIKKDGKTIEIVDYYRFLPINAFKRTKEGKESAYLRDKIANIQFNNAKLHENDAKLQKTIEKSASDITPISDRFPYKVNSLITRSNQDYTRIREEGRYTMLSEDDMKWIDENIKEDPNIRSY